MAHEFHYRRAYNEDSLYQVLAWKSTPHTLQKLWKHIRYWIIAKILTVEVLFCSWVHHLGMFSSGVIMLLIFKAVLPPRLLVRDFQNRVTCTNKPSSHTVFFFVWMLSYRSISCPKALKKGTNAAVCQWNKLLKHCFSSWVQKEIPLTEVMNYIPVIPENLKDRSFFLTNEQIQTASVLYSHQCVGQVLSRMKHPCPAWSLKTLPVARGTRSQLHFKIGLSMLWST